MHKLDVNGDLICALDATELSDVVGGDTVVGSGLKDWGVPDGWANVADDAAVFLIKTLPNKVEKAAGDAATWVYDTGSSALTTVAGWFGL